MKTITYEIIDGTKTTVEYDENAPCIICDLPVVEASTSGTVICPWCDSGIYRDGTKWQTTNKKTIKIEAKIRSIYNFENGKEVNHNEPRSPQNG